MRPPARATMSRRWKVRFPVAADPRAALDATTLTDATALFERARGHLAGRDVDAVQVEAYDLALSWADLRAAGVALDGLSAVGDDEAAFERQLAQLFCAEVVANLCHRLGARPSAFGLDAAVLGEGSRTIR